MNRKKPAGPYFPPGAVVAWSKCAPRHIVKEYFDDSWDQWVVASCEVKKTYHVITLTEKPDHTFPSYYVEPAYMVECSRCERAKVIPASHVGPNGVCCAECFLDAIVIDLNPDFHQLKVDIPEVPF